jgi:hypothetical protein
MMQKYWSDWLTMLVWYVIDRIEMIKV